MEVPFVILRYGLGFAVIAIAPAVPRRQLPNVRERWRATVPGAETTAFVWNGFAAVFVFYFGHVADFSLTYGSLGGVAITLVFFYVSAAIFIFGAELDAVLGGKRGQQAQQ